MSLLVFVPTMLPVRNRYCDRRPEICVNGKSCEMLIRTRSLAASKKPVVHAVDLCSMPPSEGVLRNAVKLTWGA